MTTYYTTPGAATRAANKANAAEGSNGLWVIGHEYDFGWFIENLDLLPERCNFKRSGSSI